MIIGFLDSDLKTLRVFKEYVAKHPSFEYVFYGDTMYAPFATKSDEELRMPLQEAIAFLVKKNVDIVVVSHEHIRTLLQELYAKDHSDKKAVRFLSQDELAVELQSIPDEVHQATGVGSMRSIHLTLHTEETDALIKEILGGFFIED